MHPSIEKNLPKFLFPHLFAAQLPKDLEPVEPTADERHRVFEAMLSIQGHPADYMYSMKALVVKSGKVRDFRRAPDGTMFARIDSLENSAAVTPYIVWQMLLLIDPDWRVASYTVMSDGLKKSAMVMVAKGRRMVVNEDNLKVVRLKIAQLRRPKELMQLNSPSDNGWFSIVCSQGAPRRYCVHFALVHLPWAFALGDLELGETLIIACRLVKEGLASLISAHNRHDWQFYDQANDGNWGNRHIGIYNRLLFHRYMAEYHHDLATLKLLDEAEVVETETPPLWMSREANAEWHEVLASLHRQATAPKPVSHYGHPLTPLDVRRVLLFCRLEGYVP